MSPKKAKAVKVLVAAVLSALTAWGVVTPDDVEPISGIVAAVITVVALLHKA